MKNNDLKILGIVAIVAIALIIVIGAFYFSHNNGTPISASVTPTVAPAVNITVTDLGGRTVQVPANVSRVACLVGPSYDYVFMLGQQDKIVMRMGSAGAWAQLTNPNVLKIPAATSPQNPNIEDLLNRSVDVVFFWDTPAPIQSMTAAGIPVISTVANDKEPATMAGFIAFRKQEVQTYASVLGPEAQARADEYNAYFDEKVNYVTSRTGNLTDAQKPKVYYVEGPSSLNTFGANSYPQRYIELAGGIAVTQNITPQGVATVTMEQILQWNPDVVFMGRVNNTSLIMNDPKWKDVNAVKNGSVYVNPNGVMVWDYGAEGPLMIEFFAQKLHPDLFKDLNMTSEIKDFYTRFYGYNLTDDQANRILNNMPPA